MQPETLIESSGTWHAGELELQRRAGVAARMEKVGAVNVRHHLIEQHRRFFPLLPFVVLGAVDACGDVWATVRAGRPGFLAAPDEHRLHVSAPRDPLDPADAGMNDGDALGLLGIDPSTRRRNRLNGQVRRTDDASFDLTVQESFGNCPQYITQRDVDFVRDPALPAPTPPRESTRLDARARSLIARADSLFVASYVDHHDGRRQVDVSHRGGKPGFVRVAEDDVLTVPDFAGNLFFNTLGNFLVNPRAGLVFVDYASGDLLQMTGDAEVVLDSPEIAAFQGAERLWRFTPRRVVYREGALPLRWRDRADGASPNSRLTGNWDEAAARLKAAALAGRWRPYRVARIVDESSTIRSFHLVPADDAGLVAFEAGQYLPVRVTLPGDTRPTLRNYSLSAIAADGFYRISVKRDGRVSRHLHEHLAVGDLIEARAPAGAFTIDAKSARPAVLMAAGVGITPLLAMLRHLVYEGLRTRHLRPTWLVYAARSKAGRAFDRELDALVRSAGGSVTLVRVLSDATGAEAGTDYEALGRISMPMLSEVLPFNDYDFYLCGPGAFMQDLYDGLRGLNIADERIHAEAFGPGGLRRRVSSPQAEASDAPDVPDAPNASAEAATQAVPVTFVRSGKTAQWMPQAGSLLELAEANGLAPEFSCRVGDCGSCRARLVAGEVAYAVPPGAPRQTGEALICCAVPAAGRDGQPAHVSLDL